MPISLACLGRCPALGLLALGALVSAGAAELTAPLPDSALDGLAVHIRKAESLLQSGRIRQAISEAEFVQRAAPGRAGTLTLLGDISFRRADFDAAKRYFSDALAIDAKCASAHLGLGRIDLLQFRRRAALQRVMTAYSLNPNDPDVVFAYSSMTPDPKLELALLQRFLELDAAASPEQRECAVGRLHFRQRLGERKLGILDSPYVRYRLPLTTWTARPGSLNGLLLAVSINGSKPLRLVLDTGAAGIVISHRSGAKLGLEYLADAGLRGVGRSGLVTRKMLADSVSIGDLHLRNCVVDVAEHGVAGGVDGAVGANLFEQFVVRLDARHRVLELIPYAGEVPQGQSKEDLWAGRDRSVPSGMESLTPMCQAGHLLLVKAELDATKLGYLVLDTGAAFSSLSRQAAVPYAEPTPFEVAGPGGTLVTASRAGPIQLRVAGQDLTDPDMISLDFGQISNFHGLEISGLIGYPMLSRYTVTVEYRDGLIGLDHSR